MIVTLRSLRGIRHLEFEVPGPGVWIVSGLNGSGKTSLFAALYRIGESQAFPRYYRTNAVGSRVDSYSRARIEYTIDGKTVSYRYGGQRWRATPRALADLLSESPFEAVEFVEASGQRVEPFADEINPRRLRDPEQSMRSFMSEVLANDKWQSLRYVSTRRGKDNIAFLLPFRSGNAQHYYSERSFSLGELCVLRLANRMVTVPDDSLLLVDEVEMALHPQAQVRLLEAMRRLADEKRLTVLFSTHSATLVKTTPRRNLILLNPDSQGNVTSVVGAYPAQVLGEIAFTDEINCDYVFYVEDEEARLVVEALVERYVAMAMAAAGRRPQYRVIPVGGFVQVCNLMKASSAVLPTHVRRYALLDADAREHLEETREVKFLPCTPELGLVNHIEELVRENSPVLTEFCKAFPGATIDLARVVRSGDYCSIERKAERDRAKARLSFISDEVSRQTGWDERSIRRELYQVYCHRGLCNDGELKGLFGPLFHG